MAYEKYIKDGKVAVLVSPGFGAGWYSWIHKEGVLFDKEIVQAILDKDISKAIEITKRKYPDAYCGGAEDLCVVWLAPGTQFEINEYDGSESLVELEQKQFLIA